MNVRDPKIQDDIRSMLIEAEEIADDLSSYFYYHQRRFPIVQDLLEGSSQN